MKTFHERFWEKVSKSDGCWQWIGQINLDGYGKIKSDGRLKSAHRISYEMAKGPIEPGKLIDHACHNRSCVNPDHLRPVTQKQNLENQVSATRTSKSGVRGVFYYPSRKKYVGGVRHHKKLHHVGYFATIEEAERAVIAKRNELFTHNDADRRAA